MAAAARAFPGDAEVPVAWTGRLLRDPALRAGFEAELAGLLPRARLRPPAGDSLAGAALLAAAEEPGLLRNDDQDGAAMRVGHGRADLPVPDGTPMGGYLDRPGPSAGVLDPLSVNAITWFDGERRFALAIADVICVNEDLAPGSGRDARSLGCELWLAASHTHSGPGDRVRARRRADARPWLDQLTEADGAAVRRAIECERPVRRGGPPRRAARRRRGPQPTVRTGSGPAHRDRRSPQCG